MLEQTSKYQIFNLILLININLSLLQTTDSNFPLTVSHLSIYCIYTIYNKLEFILYIHSLIQHFHHYTQIKYTLSAVV